METLPDILGLACANHTPLEELQTRARLFLDCRRSKSPCWSWIGI